MPKKDNVSNISKFKKDVEASTEDGEDTPPDTGGPDDIDNSRPGDNNRTYIGSKEAVSQWMENHIKMEANNKQNKERNAVYTDAKKDIIKTAADEFGIHKSDLMLDIKDAVHHWKRDLTITSLPEDRQHDVKQLKIHRESQIEMAV